MKTFRGKTVFTLVSLALVALVAPADHGNPSGWSWVIVQSDTTPDAAAAVRNVGGSVVVPLPIVDGVSAEVPKTSIDSLRRSAHVRSVTPNYRVRVHDSSWDDGGASPYQVQTETTFLKKSGINGSGVGVALIDSGVTPMADLQGRISPVPDPVRAGQVVPCLNLSGEPTCDDTFGHGTFMAGLIAGDGTLSGGQYAGVAPKANIISVKIAGKDGSADVTKILAAIQYVVSFKDTLNIRVLNLSLGTDSPVSYSIDPMNFAVERAWQSGIAVIVSASNRGPNPQTISKPGDDPLVITVGAVDDLGQNDISNDRLPKFSGRGPTLADGLAKPDIVAPGAKVASLRAPNSTIGNLPGGINTYYRRGSGTSMSAAVTSGIAALLLQAHSDWSPDRLKFALTSTADQVASNNPMDVGSGIVQATDAVFAGAGLANQNVPPNLLSNASGSLDGSRGHVLVKAASCSSLQQVVDPNCNQIQGNYTGEMNRTFSADDYRNQWTASTWYSSQWVANATISGYSWYATEWNGYSWYGYSWYGTDQYGKSENNTFYGASVPGSAFYGSWL